jgi:conjugative relaxase-like TrwC/TraI family protein
MLTHKVLNRQDVGRLASYYEDSADDYYAKEGESSQWQGKGAEILGLHGDVDSQRFRELLSGQVDPASAPVRESTRDDSNARTGIDFTFSAPKSVSIQALVHGDGDIIKAHDRAVAKAIEVAEGMAQARQKVHGKTQVERTGNLIVAKFRHETSRERDPQLHTHAVIMNLTQRKDGEWRALLNDRVIQSTKYLGAVYRAELARGLSELGFELRHEREGFFELAHISQEQLDGFSQRSAQIEDHLARNGLSRETASTAEKQQAAMVTRARKTSEDREVIFEQWQDRAKALDMQLNRGERSDRSQAEHAAASKVMEQQPRQIAAKTSLHYAIKHLTERESTMREEVLLDIALKHAVGTANVDDIQDQMKEMVKDGFLIQSAPKYVLPLEKSPPLEREQRIKQLSKEKNVEPKTAAKQIDEDIAKGRLVEAPPMYTTQTAIEREKRILQIERDGRGKILPVMDAEAAIERLKEVPLNDGQRAGAKMILTTDNLVSGIQGYAGVGKSHMLDHTKRILEEQGFNVRALAPYGSQVKALRELGVESNTLASFLYAKDKKIDSKTVLVLDEAGVVPTRQMEQMLKITERFGARIILLGDTEQTKAIEAGRPFDQLQVAGMRTARVEEILRQHAPELKRAVEHAAKGRTKESLDHIKDLRQIADGEQRHKAIAKLYGELTKEERNNSLIVTGTNQSRLELNDLVRQTIGVKGQGVELDTLYRRDTTQAERRYSKHYRVGDIIQPDRDYQTGLKKGELYRVSATGPGNRLTVVDREHQKVEFSPMTHTKLSIYTLERTELAIGDVVRGTRNDAMRDLANGDRMIVVDVQADRVRLYDGKKHVDMPTDKPLHLMHAYASTVHSAQGLTKDRVIVNVDSQSRTTAKDVWYVAISRARHDAHVFTDDLSKLPRAIARANVKAAALDLGRRRRVKEQIERIQRMAKTQTGPEIARKQPEQHRRIKSDELAKPVKGGRERERSQDRERGD